MSLLYLWTWWRVSQGYFRQYHTHNYYYYSMLVAWTRFLKDVEDNWQITPKPSRLSDSSGDPCVGLNCLPDVTNSSYYLLANRLIDEDYLIFVDLNHINVNIIWRASWWYFWLTRIPVIWCYMWSTVIGSGS